MRLQLQAHKYIWDPADPRRLDVKAVLLLSGGLDSYTAGAIARSDGYELYALTIRYGQVHAREIEAARQVATALGVARHLELDVPLSKIGGSALVGDGEIPKDRAARRDAAFRRPTCRRATPCSCRWRMAWAEVVGAGGDRDRRQRARLLRLSRLPARVPPRRSSASPRWRRAPASKAGRCSILAPLLRPDERPTSSAAALALGVDYGLTLSCYDPVAGRPAVRPLRQLPAAGQGIRRGRRRGSRALR